jgi:hypothetical protein
MPPKQAGKKVSYFLLVDCPTISIEDVSAESGKPRKHVSAGVGTVFCEIDGTMSTSDKYLKGRQVEAWQAEVVAWLSLEQLK